jgi:hypothetical protein
VQENSSYKTDSVAWQKFIFIGRQINQKAQLKAPFNLLTMSKGCCCNLAVSILLSTLSGLNYLIINHCDLPIKLSPPAFDNTLLGNNVYCAIITKGKGQHVAWSTL